MRRILLLTGIGALALGACERATESSGEGGMALMINLASSSAFTLDSGRVFVEGPTNRRVSAVPGDSVTIDGLAEGSYTVTLEGFAGDDLDQFGQRGGIEVVAGRNTTTSITLAPFLTVLDPFPMYSTNLQAVATFAAIPGAEGYRIEWDTSATFVTLQETTVTGTSATVSLAPLGRFHIRVRGVSASGAVGRSSDPRSIETLREIDFDIAPDGSPITPGTVLNGVYTPFGIEFEKFGPGANCGSGPQVYANSNQPAAAPTFQGNTVTTCPQGIASDISENGFGVIEVRFGQPTSQVCIDVAPPNAAHAAFLEAFDELGASLGRFSSPLGVTLLHCITQPGTTRVRFSGDGDQFARFDNLVVAF